jgi:hypothetical protein
VSKCSGTTDTDDNGNEENLERPGWGVAMNGLAPCKYEADERRKELLQWREAEPKRVKRKSPCTTE